MTLGFVLISASPERGHEVYDVLLSVPEVTELHPLMGEYDLLAKLEAKDADAIGTVVSTKIRPIRGVADTKTLTELRR